MLHRLLITTEGLKLCLEYGLCLILLLGTLVAFGFLNRKTKKEMRAETVKKSCLKAVKYAEEILGDVKHKGTYMLLGSTKLAHLSAFIADSSWYAFQIVYAKKDIVFEGIANALDVLASEISTASENGYLPAGEYEAYVKKAIAELTATVEKLDTLILK